jgi:hypothetical protein
MEGKLNSFTMFERVIDINKFEEYYQHNDSGLGRAFKLAPKYRKFMLRTQELLNKEGISKGEYIDRYSELRSEDENLEFYFVYVCGYLTLKSRSISKPIVTQQSGKVRNKTHSDIIRSMANKKLSYSPFLQELSSVQIRKGTIGSVNAKDISINPDIIKDFMTKKSCDEDIVQWNTEFFIIYGAPTEHMSRLIHLHAQIIEIIAVLRRAVLLRIKNVNPVYLLPKQVLNDSIVKKQPIQEYIEITNIRVLNHLMSGMSFFFKQSIPKYIVLKFYPLRVVSVVNK